MYRMKSRYQHPPLYTSGISLVDVPKGGENLTLAIVLVVENLKSYRRGAERRGTCTISYYVLRCVVFPKLDSGMTFENFKGQNYTFVLYRI